MRDLEKIIADIRVICEEHPVMEDRLIALQLAGYEDIEYRYMKGYKVILWSDNHGFLATYELPRKGVYRIQVGYNEVKKGYPAAWCVDIPSHDIKYEPELPF